MTLMTKILFMGLLVSSIFAEPPIFDAYPTIKKLVPHISLGIYPTPLIHAKKLATDLHMKDFYIKDDGVNGRIDKSGIKYPGGNKNRKLEFLLAQAKECGYSTVITVGGVGSNHACETAQCAQHLGMKSVLLLNDQKPTSYTQRNLKLDILFGADILYSTIKDGYQLTTQAQQLANLNHYYYIPMGGSNELGSLGFVNAMFELREQINKKEMPEPDVLYIPLGSTGTAAGAIVGAKLAGFTCRIIPVRISFNSMFKTDILLTLIKQTEYFMHQLDQKIPYQPLPNNVKTFDQQMKYLQDTYKTFLEHNLAGGGYAQLTKESAEAIDIIQKHIGLKLEGTYTGKTMAALIGNALQKKHQQDVVLFWNTFSYGSFEYLTTRIPLTEVISKLPRELLHYLTDPFQEFDRGI